MGRKGTVIVTEPLEPHALEYLKQESQLIQIDKAELDKHIGAAEGLVVRTYTQVTPELLTRAPKLKVVGRAGVALDNINVPACRAKGVEVVHTPAANTLAVVDFTFAMILQLNRRYWFMDKPLAPDVFHKVRNQAFGRFMKDTTLGIIGVGRIGSRVGRAAAGLGMNVLYNDVLDVKLDYPAKAVDKATLLSQSDIITIHVPLTTTTRGMMNAAAFAQMKQGAQFINAARGECMVTADLAAALRSGHLGGAVVDCHNPEPPPADYPLFGLENVFLTPHIAARVPAATKAMSDVVYDVVRVIRGEKPQYPALEGSY